MRSIRSKITVVMLVAILTSLIAFSVITYITVDQESDRTSVENMQLISENVALSLDSYLDSLMQSVDMAIHIANDSLAASPLCDYLPKDGAEPTPEQRAQISATLEGHGDLVETAFRSIANQSNGVVTYYYCISEEIGMPEHGFFFSRVGKPDFERQDVLVAAELDPADTEHTTWYYSPIAAGEAVWIGPYKAHFLDERWTVSYVAPIYCEEVLIGVLGMDILFDTMIELVRNVRIYDSGFACLVDRDGLILYHPELPIGTVADQASSALYTEIFHRESSGDDIILYDVRGEERQLAFSTLSNGMKLVVMAPTHEINASWHNMVWIVFAAAMAILVLFTLILFPIVQRITDPLMRLTLASQELADGNYNIELEYRGQDEVGILTDSFRRMRDRLRSHISVLSRQAYSDPLTGVKNKGSFDLSAETLNQRIQQGGADMPEFAIVMFDCNRLKQINDKFGHDRGDIYLQTVCRAICKTYAHSPVFRVGGDEFVVLLQGLDLDQRDQLLTAFTATAEAINATAENPWETVNAAKGMAVFLPEFDTDVEQVLHRADTEMYEDKRQYKAANA